MQSSVDSISTASLLPGLSAKSHFRVFPNIGEIEKPEQVTTHFERKYVSAGLQVYELSVELGERDRQQRSFMLGNIVGSK